MANKTQKPKWPRRPISQNGHEDLEGMYDCSSLTIKLSFVADARRSSLLEVVELLAGPQRAGLGSSIETEESRGGVGFQLLGEEGAKNGVGRGDAPLDGTGEEGGVQESVLPRTGKNHRGGGREEAKEREKQEEEKGRLGAIWEKRLHNNSNMSAFNCVKLFGTCMMGLEKLCSTMCHKNS